MALDNAGYHFVWLIWAVAFMLPWIMLFIVRPKLRRPIFWASVLTTPLGLTEPLFVPAYWNPPSLFDLAQRTGFDIESLIFTFATGGIAFVGYRALVHAPESRLDHVAHLAARHRWHGAALVSPFLVFMALVSLPTNPIHAAIGALLAGALATQLCRPDLWRNTLIGGLLFLGLYVVFLFGLKWLWPGYIEAVWNLPALLQWRPAGLPIEELGFGFSFGMYWSSAYEHFAWRAPSFLR
jgi:hypothetical protein